jgi:hypothetical protein
LSNRDTSAGFLRRTFAALTAQPTINSETKSVVKSRSKAVSSIEVDEMFALKKAGLSNAKIALMLGRHSTTIAQRLQSPDSRDGPVSESEKATILHLKDEGLSQTDISRRVGRSRKVIFSIMDLQGEAAEKTGPYNTDELLRLIFLRACKLSLRQCSRALGRHYYSVENKWDQSFPSNKLPPSPAKLSKEEIASITNALTSDVTLEVLLGRLSPSSRSVMRLWLDDVRKVVTEPQRRRRFHESEDRNLKDLYEQGVPWREIALRLDRNFNSVRMRWFRIRGQEKSVN